MNREDNKECCGTCSYHKPAWETGKLAGYSCTNEDSDGYGLSTAYDDRCEEWEERE